jgi:hypothetical protein
MRRHRRHVRVPPDLTSLFDVLFIVIFAVLIRGAAMQQALAKAEAPPEPGPPPPPQPASALKTQALAQLDTQLAARPTVIARISKAGTLTMLETGEKQTPLDVPLLEHSPDPDIAMSYLGDRSADLRLCKLIVLHSQIADLANHLVIIAPDARGADLPHALYTGLRRDVERCQSEQRGLAVVVEPDAVGQGSAMP